jgi:hypothetical protein
LAFHFKKRKPNNIVKKPHFDEKSEQYFGKRNINISKII